MYRLRQDVNVLICTPGRLSDIASHDPHGGTGNNVISCSWRDIKTSAFCSTR